MYHLWPNPLPKSHSATSPQVRKTPTHCCRDPNQEPVSSVQQKLLKFSKRVGRPWLQCMLDLVYFYLRLVWGQWFFCPMPLCSVSTCISAEVWDRYMFSSSDWFQCDGLFAWVKCYKAMVLRGFLKYLHVSSLLGPWSSPHWKFHPKIAPGIYKQVCLFLSEYVYLACCHNWSGHGCGRSRVRDHWRVGTGTIGAWGEDLVRGAQEAKVGGFYMAWVHPCDGCGSPLSCQGVCRLQQSDHADHTTWALRFYHSIWHSQSHGELSD